MSVHKLDKKDLRLLDRRNSRRDPRGKNRRRHAITVRRTVGGDPIKLLPGYGSYAMEGRTKGTV